MRYRDVPLEEMVALNHSIRLQRNALVMRINLLVEVMHSKGHRAVKQLQRVEVELIRLAAEVEGQALRVYGSEAWDRARHTHWAECIHTRKVSTCEPTDVK